MGNNFSIWDKFKQPPKWAKKDISAGRLKGMTDINPQWRLMAMTEAFGPVGIGWKYTIDKQWTEKGAGDEIGCFCNVSVYFKHGDVWSDAIPGTGGSAFVAKESRGPYTSDECFKMALTDALSVAMKAIGVGAEVYCGANYFPPAPRGKAELKRDSIAKEFESCQTLDELGKIWKRLADEKKQRDYIAEKDAAKERITNAKAS